MHTCWRLRRGLKRFSSIRRDSSHFELSNLPDLFLGSRMGLDWITPCHLALDTVNLNNAMVHSRSHSPFHADRASIFSILVLSSRGKDRRIKCMDHRNHENARLTALGGLMQSLCTVTLKLPATILSHDQQMNRMKLPCHSKDSRRKQSRRRPPSPAQHATCSAALATSSVH